jgi:hypothetical protein
MVVKCYSIKTTITGLGISTFNGDATLHTASKWLILFATCLTISDSRRVPNIASFALLIHLLRLRTLILSDQLSHGIFSHLLRLGCILLRFSYLLFQILNNLCGFIKFTFEIYGPTDRCNSSGLGNIDFSMFRRRWLMLWLRAFM